jgi:hypothetical protein
LLPTKVKLHLGSVIQVRISRKWKILASLIWNQFQVHGFPYQILHGRISFKKSGCLFGLSKIFVFFTFYSLRYSRIKTLFNQRGLHHARYQLKNLPSPAKFNNQLNCDQQLLEKISVKLSGMFWMISKNHQSKIFNHDLSCTCSCTLWLKEDSNPTNNKTHLV